MNFLIFPFLKAPIKKQNLENTIIVKTRCYKVLIG